MASMMGEIQLFAGTFAPGGWMFCEGQLLEISQFQALFSLLGTTFGGDGQATFALPDLRGRVPIGDGAGIGLTPRKLGQSGGRETVQLLLSNLPSHNHPFHGAEAAPTTVNAGVPSGGLVYRPDDGSPLTTLAPGAILTTGGTSAHENRQPYLPLQFIICIDGTFPSRS